MGKAEARVSISLDADVLADVERLRARTGESLSAIISRAVRILIAREEHEAKVRQYVRWYAEMPEEEAKAWQEAARATLASQDW